MSKQIITLLAALLLGLPPALAQNTPDPEQLEKSLQRLPWEQFKAVVEAIPKLKADVDAYGALGWQIVQANYSTYRWRKSIRKLDEVQQKHLAELIVAAGR